VMRPGPGKFVVVRVSEHAVMLADRVTDAAHRIVRPETPVACEPAGPGQRLGCSHRISPCAAIARVLGAMHERTRPELVGTAMR
jgi:hypothetical protein